MSRAAETTEKNTHGFSGALPPRSALGRPCGNRNEAQVRTQRVPAAERTLTGWLSVTTAGTL